MTRVTDALDVSNAAHAVQWDGSRRHANAIVAWMRAHGVDSRYEAAKQVTGCLYPPTIWLRMPTAEDRPGPIADPRAPFLLQVYAGGWIVRCPAAIDCWIAGQQLGVEAPYWDDRGERIVPPKVPSAYEV